MHTKQPDATICCARGLFRQITKLQLGLRFLQPHRWTAGNLTSACWCGRTRSMEIGGWNSEGEFWWGTGRRSCSPTYRTTRRWCSSGERWWIRARRGSTRGRRWGAGISPARDSERLRISGIWKWWIGTTAWFRCQTWWYWRIIQTATTFKAGSTPFGVTTSTTADLVETTGVPEVNPQAQTQSTAPVNTLFL